MRTYLQFTQGFTQLLPDLPQLRAGRDELLRFCVRARLWTLRFCARNRNGTYSSCGAANPIIAV